MSSGFLANKTKIKIFSRFSKYWGSAFSIENNFVGAVKRRERGEGGGEVHKTLFVQLSLSLFEWSH